MTDRPILFSGPMVRAILAGQKTQTRRVVDVARVQKKGTLNSAGWRPFDLDVAADRRAVETNCGRVCPYGEVGDRLWVRETWRTDTVGDAGINGVRFRGDDAFVPIEPTREAADAWVDAHENGKHGAMWRPSIFIKRWASRLTLTVESVRVEPLHAITEADALAEGMTYEGDELTKPTTFDGIRWEPIGARLKYVALWDSINGKRAPWLSNPWVWVVAFAREWAEPEERR